MDINEKEIKETEAKTFAYLSAVIAGFLSADLLILFYGFFSDLQVYLTYHNNEEDFGGKKHYVDLNALRLHGCLGLLLALALFGVIHFWVRKIRCVEKRFPVIIASSLILVLSIPVLGYITICIAALISYDMN